MRTSTLRAYLDCYSDSDLPRRLKVLKARGYSGKDKALGRHVKAIVDRYLTVEDAGRETSKERMRSALRGSPKAEKPRR